MKIIELLREDDESGEVHGTGQLIPFPQGTTMVDVSDIYDWYKLGMVISDLDDADPKSFGQGAPHTVIAFGSEEEEHKMLPLLKRLGLGLHDIDRPEDVKKAHIAKDIIAKMEENKESDIIAEKKKRKSKYRQAAYGPGPYGWYGYHAGYSGDSDGGGGEGESVENENFADGKNPGRKGLAKRSGVNTKASVSSLRKTAKNSSGEKQRMAHWLANMKAGRAKKK
jgi:hypothetical protein